MTKINRIEICGNIASGKTTLAKAFGVQLGYANVFEDFTSVQTLTDFYQSPKEFAFETEIIFTLLHYYQLKKLNGNFAVADFSLINDYAFALTTLNKKEFDIYEKLFDDILYKIGFPKHVIMVKTNINTLLNRISTRSRNNELLISEDYLISIQKNIERSIVDKFSCVKVTTIDSDKCNIENYTQTFLKSLIK
ncbi:MAG: deoxynucleoside kinase [Bacilli bacterium]|nr:deoxynucleoside kinase [Bacilli bacterium]